MIHVWECNKCGAQAENNSGDFAPQGWIITRRGPGWVKVMCPYCAQQRSAMRWNDVSRDSRKPPSMAQQRSAMRWNNVGNGMRGSSTGESSSIIKGCISWLGYLVGGLIIAVILIILF